MEKFSKREKKTLQDLEEKRKRIEQSKKIFFRDVKDNLEEIKEKFELESSSDFWKKVEDNLC